MQTQHRKKSKNKFPNTSIFSSEETCITIQHSFNMIIHLLLIEDFIYKCPINVCKRQMEDLRRDTVHSSRHKAI